METGPLPSLLEALGGELGPGLRVARAQFHRAIAFHGWSFLGMEGRGLGHLGHLLIRQPPGGIAAGRVGVGGTWRAEEGNSTSQGKM